MNNSYIITHQQTFHTTHVMLIDEIRLAKGKLIENNILSLVEYKKMMAKLTKTMKITAVLPANPNTNLNVLCYQTHHVRYHFCHLHYVCCVKLHMNDLHIFQRLRFLQITQISLH